jgi:membrane protein DedA with SNARE-associated domain
MPLGKFVLYSTAGAVPWSIALVSAGTQLGAHWVDIRKALQPFDLLIAVAVVAGFGLLLWMRLGRPGWPKKDGAKAA